MADAESALRDAAPLRIEAVAFAPGTGRLVRRAGAVLFDPTGDNPKLASAFDQAPEGTDVRDLVIDLVTEDDLQVAPFALVRWNDGIELLVFGDVAVHTSAPTAPMVSGASSTTWIEHHVAGSALPAEIPLQVWSGTTPEAGTNLRLGIAACDGFRLDLAIDDALAALALAAEPAAPAPAPLGDVDAGEPQEQSAEVAPVAPAPVADPAPHMADTVFDDVAVAAAAPLDVPVSAGHLDDVDEHSLEVVLDEPPTNFGSVSGPDPVRQTLADDQPDNTDADLFAVDDPAPVPNGTAPLLEFDTPAPPVNVPPPPAPPATPVLGVLASVELDDVAISEPAVLGRRPTPEPGAAAVVIDHPEVSRNHAAIGIDGWAITLTDLDSRNGTWVQPPHGAGLRRLDPGERIVLIDGMVVHLGSVDARFVWRGRS